MKHIVNLLISSILLLLTLSACEKADIASQPLKGEGYEVHVLVKNFDHVRYDTLSRAVVPAREVCTRLHVAAYRTGKKVLSVNQTSGDKDFGKLSFRLPAGKYYLVIVGHNGHENASLTEFRKISFGGKVTDTYVFAREITLEGAVDIQATMEHCVSKIAFTIEDPIPAEVTHLKFSYTGGSSTLDVVDGVGVVKSHQTEDRVVAASAHTEASTYDLYTFPRTSEGGTIKLEVEALNDKNEVISKRTFTEIPVVMRTLTCYTGKFFPKKEEDPESDLVIKANDEWKKVLHLTY